MKLRMQITKDKDIRFISHLEYVRTIGRAIRRAKLPAAYSEGFNPHLKFSLALIGLDHSVGVVTNNFHVFRGTAIGRKCGCKEIYPIPSKYCSWRLLIYIPREILAIIKDKIMGNL